MLQSKIKTPWEMKILALGPLRSGTASMATALEILGYNGVHHGVKAIDNPNDWEIISRAADATFSVLPTYTGKAFTREQWDELYGPYEAATDVASCFAMELIAIYPEARVILVERDFDKWYKSIDEALFQNLWGLTASFSIRFISPLLGYKGGIASRKMILGWLGAHNLDEARHNARGTFEKHYKQLRETVPADKLLIYRLGDGWDPLCEFLGKPVPDVKFPWVNDTEALTRAIHSKVKRNMMAVAAKLLWLGAVATIGLGIWIMS